MFPVRFAQKRRTCSKQVRPILLPHGILSSDFVTVLVFRIDEGFQTGTVSRIAEDLDVRGIPEDFFTEFFRFVRSPDSQVAEEDGLSQTAGFVDHVGERHERFVVLDGLDEFAEVSAV